jgi:hypothetical protein
MPSFPILRISALTGLAFLGVAFAVTAATADDCTDVRLDGFGGSMEHVEVRDQRQIGSCYAHTAAQMYDAWRFMHDETNYEHQSSGFEIGQRFKIGRNEYDNSIDGGVVEEVIPLIFSGKPQKRGTCSQRELDSAFHNRNASMSIDEFASGIMAIFNRHNRRYLALREEYFGSRAANASPTLRQVPMASDQTRVDRTRIDFSTDAAHRSEVLSAGKIELRKFLDDHWRVDGHIDFDQLRADGDTVDLFDTLSVASCPPSHRLGTKGRFDVRNHRARNSRALIDGELDQGPRAYPIGISYCASVLKEGRSYVDRQPNDDQCGSHASLVIGRRRSPKTRRCEYAIRNSWGQASNYHRDWAAEPSKGVVWVEGETLERAVFGVQIMEARSEN